MFVTSQMNYYYAQQRVGYDKIKLGPHNQCMVRTLQGDVMSVDALQIYVVLCRTQWIYTSWINEGIKRWNVDSRQI